MRDAAASWMVVMPSSVARSATVLSADMCTAIGAAGSANCFVSVRVCAFQTTSEVSVASSSVVPAKARLRAMAPLDCGRIAVVPLLKSTRLTPLNVDTAAIFPESATPPVARPGTLTVTGVFVKSVDEKYDNVVVPSLRSSASTNAAPDRAMNDGLILVSAICCAVGDTGARSADHNVLPVASFSTKKPVVPFSTADAIGERSVTAETSVGTVGVSAQSDAFAPVVVRRKLLPPSRTMSLLLTHERACVSAPAEDWMNSVMPPEARET